VKRIVVSFIAVILVAICTSVVHADVSSLIGKKIDGQFPVRVNGELSEVPAITIDGVSYIPLRAAGELFGANVSWIDGEIQMNKLPETQLSPEELAEKARIEQEKFDKQTNAINENIKEQDRKQSLFEINSRIEFTQGRINSLNEEIRYYQKKMEIEPGTATIDGGFIPYKETEQYQKDLEKLESLRSQLAKLETELEELQQKKAELENSSSDTAE
jgi:hypothetical protein